MAIKIVTDSSVELPTDIITQFDIHIIPLNVHFGERHFKSGVDLDSKMFFDLMREEEELPKSSSPSPNDFYEKFVSFDENDDILVISLSSQLSSTYDSAMMGKQMFMEAHPERNIEVIDTHSASAGLGLIVYETAKLVDAGAAFEEAVQKAKTVSHNSHTVFILETLENVIKGGRLDRVRGAIAKTLNIKLMMHEHEGKVEVLEKIRGNKKAIRRFVEQIGEYSKNFEEKVLTLSHANCEDKALSLIELIKEHYPFKEILLSEVGPLIGTYSGEGGLIMAYEKN